MSSTQKYKGYTIVPWYNAAEWQNVYKLIFGQNTTKDNQKNGLDTITTWQMRISHLPSGIEGTLCILEALLIDNKELSERQYQILCASSIMRFLNICVAHRAQVNSFTRTAKDHRIPDWIISIRHDFAHSQKLPSVSLLNLALKESFKWLEATYWIPELENMSDNIISSGVDTVEDKIHSCSLQMYELMGLYCNVFVYDALNLCYDEFIQDKLELVDASSEISEYPKAIIYLLEHGVENLGDYEWNKCLDQIMHSHFYNVAPNTLTDKKGNYFTQYQNMANLINLIEKNNKLPELVQELFYLCSNKKETSETLVGVAQWLDEIFKGMVKFRKSTSKSAPDGIPFKQLHKDTVKNIKKMKQFVFITVPEQYRKYFITNLQILLEITHESSVSFIKDFNKRINHPVNVSEDSLKLQEEDIDYDDRINKFLGYVSDENDTCVMDTSVSVSLPKNEVKSCKRWSLVADTTAFESCALGLIPPNWIAF